MPSILHQKELEEIIKPLPLKEREVLKSQPLTKEGLAALIARCEGLMKRDMWVGGLWFLAYTVSLFKTGFSNFTIGLGVFGLVYFGYTIFTTGAYGLNRLKVKVYKQLLDKMNS